VQLGGGCVWCVVVCGALLLLLLLLLFFLLLGEGEGGRIRGTWSNWGSLFPTEVVVV
jgi:hypothetical protein